MTTNEQIHDFIRDYFAFKIGQVVERKSWIRFKNAADDTSGVSCDVYTLAALFKAYTGNNPSYELRKGKGMNEQRREEYVNKCFKIADALTHDPTSFTDLYNNGLAHKGAPDDICDSAMRKCFKAMAVAGVIGCVEIKTCGKCHIRLYYLND